VLKKLAKFAGVFRKVGVDDFINLSGV